MEDVNLSIATIAQQLMLSANMIQMWLDGKWDMPYMHVWRIADLLGLDTEDLFEST